MAKRDELIGNAGKGVQILAAAAPVVVGAPVGTDVPSTQLPAQGRTVLDIEGGDAPQVISVVLFRNDLPNPQAGVPRLARARVEYGNAGARSEFLCDWLNGCAFTIATRRLRISVVADPLLPLFQGFYGCSAAYGAVPSAYRQPQLTQGLPEVTVGTLPLLPGQTIEFAQPVLAQSVRFLTFPDEPIQVVAREPVVGLNRYMLNYGIAGLNPPPEIPIANDVTGFRVTNTGVVDIEQIRAIWRLAV